MSLMGSLLKQIMYAIAIIVLVISQGLAIAVMIGSGVWKINFNKNKPLNSFSTFDERDMW